MKLHDLSFFIAFAALVGSAPNVSAQSLERIHIHPYEKDIGYAQIVRQGDHLYISGIVGEGDSLEAQMLDIYRQLGQMLAPYGADTRHIVREVVYTRDIEALKAAIPARKVIFAHELYPASSWVQVDRLYDPHHLIEIEFEVILPEQK